MTTAGMVRFSEDEIRARIAQVGWFHQIEIAPGIVTPGRDQSPLKLQRLNIPEEMAGLRVLDIGANDGFFSFLCERRGAQVLAIDHNPTPGFQVAHELLGSQVEFRTLDIYDLSPETIGQFDIVLCLGVLYHLRHPLLAIDRLRSVCKGRVIIETQICDHYFLDEQNRPIDLARRDPLMVKVPMAQFYPGDELNGDPTNWWAPNLVALHGMLASSGFAIDETIVDGGRVCVHCTPSGEGEFSAWVPAYSVDDGHGQVYRMLEAGYRPRRGPAPQPAAETEAGWRELALSLSHNLAMQTALSQQLQQMLAQRDAELADLRARAQWLDDQARSARHALAVVENGLALRLLNRIGRKR